MSNKKKKNANLTTKLSIPGITIGTFWYYIRNIIYILAINVIVAGIYLHFKAPALVFLNTFLNTTRGMNIAYSLFIVGIFTVYKIIFYGNSVYFMKTKTHTNVFELFTLSLKRFFPVIITIICYVIAVLLFSVLLLLPGIYVAFAFFCSIFITAVGDVGKTGRGETTNLFAPKGVDALTASKELMQDKLLRTMVATIISITILYFLGGLIYNNLVANNPDFDDYFKLLIRFMTTDIFIIYGALLFADCEAVDAKNEEIRLDKEMEEKAKIYSELSQNQAIIRNSGKR